jgi:spore coat protein CotF
MNDKLIMENILLLLKGTCEVYVHGSQEASNKKVHEVLKESLVEILKMQYEVYTKMTECGWYQINNIKSSEIKKTLSQLQNKRAN